jgi:hemerythrin superfamily protein
MAQSKKNTRTPDAIALLKGDHRRVAGLFEKFEKARGASKKSIAREICMELSVHTMLEETLFYPAVASKVEDDLMDESHVEHDSAKVLIAEILAGSPSDRFYDAKVTVLKEIVKHHVKEEEQRGGLFTQARKSKVDMVEMREVLEARREELMAQYRKGIPTPVTRSFGKPRLKQARPVA